MTIRGLSISALLAALALAGCNDESLQPPPAPSAGALFQRYVSIGNSLTAGLQSAGINDSTQLQAYPVILAHQMGTTFYPPLLSRPGCPPPFTNVFTNTRLGTGSTASTCFYRAPGVLPYVSNVAVPGAAVGDVTSNTGAGTNANPLTQLVLGGRTQLQAAMAVHPTFLSVWIGNNDVLGSFTALPNAGDSTLITPVATFQASYQKIVDSIKASGAKAVLIGVANVTEIPYASTGSIYFEIANNLVAGVAFPPTFHVDPLCAPAFINPAGKGDSTLVPFPFGVQLIAAAAAGATDTLHCTETSTVQPAELRKLVSTMLAYNAFISAAASTNSWAYVDPNPVLDSLRQDPQQVAPFPNVGSPASPTPCSGSPFGLAFTCDGVHPSASTHILIARHLAQAINAKFSTNIPLP
ncbi:MAG TPA: SGNH/GDSL hydrolase family protein [Gemmatimonadales bacterium]|nr:SGNH/GDSL hydrolase family protein [Gemmatimonadales bacterium]